MRADGHKVERKESSDTGGSVNINIKQKESCWMPQTFYLKDVLGNPKSTNFNKAPLIKGIDVTNDLFNACNHLQFFCSG